MRHTRLYLILWLAIGPVAMQVMAQGGTARQMQDRSAAPRQPAPLVPPHPVDLILGRPTGTSVVLSVLCDCDAAAVVAYGMQKPNLSDRTGRISLAKDRPREIILEKLRPDTAYFYRLLDGGSEKTMGEGSFHTARPPGSTFTFTVTADSHLDQNTDPALYQRTLATALADRPDFHVDLGDTFMTEKHENRGNATRQYLAQRFYFGQLAHAAPLFLVLGNHDGEERKLLRDGADSLAVWANTMRKLYFPNPVPDDFFTGNAAKDPLAGLLQDYSAWQWGDALFVVLEPYWHAANRRADERWELSLGESQYNWLKQTLEVSRARFKMVFLHQLVGGIDRQGRGGVEAAAFGEWGGKNADGSDGFQDHRPGWDEPVHQLLVRHHVTIVFHGHDHLFAHQELDGIVYQEVPQPGDPHGNTRTAAEYGYHDGVILGSSGYMRVVVSPAKVRVEYVRSWLPKNATPAHSDGEIAFSCEIPARPGSK